jgi:RHS repeat-associated protein
VLPEEAALNPIITGEGLTQSSISLSWSQVSGPGTATFSQFNGGTYASFSAAGVYELQLTATSGSYSASGDVMITVYNAVPPPSASIDMPEDATVVTAPTNFIGTASSPILLSYQLQYRFKNADGVTPNPWTTFGSGATSVTNGVLGTLDPTMMLNGIYEIQLVASDTMGQTVATSIQTVSVEKNLKVGQFSISFQDLNVPVSGIPMQIIRSYDSRDQRLDDFGIGWSLGIKNITLQKTRSMGPNWYQTFYDDPLFPFYALDPVQPREITVTMGGNKVYHFGMQVTPMHQYFAPIESVQVTFTNMPGTYGGLGVDGDNEADIDSSLGYVDLINLNDFSYYDPARFYFTNEVGDVYVIDETNGLESMTDPNQNTLLIETNGIFWTNSLTGSSGVGIRFARDAQGRIAQIIDPSGNALNYRYDTNSNLTGFIDQNTNTTTYAYTNIYFPHYLTTIIDARGIQAMRTVYDDTGRIIQEIGPNGNVVNFTHDFSNDREEVTDGLGYTTVNYYDSDGNVIATVDPLGGVTTYQYDGLDDQIQKVDALGNTNTYTYDLQGNQTSQTDPLGNTTHLAFGPYREVTSMTTPRGYTLTCTYDKSGNLLQQTDPLGNVSSNSYDLGGNLVMRTDALGNIVSNAYGGPGRVLSSTVIDPQGDVLRSYTFTYDTNGNQLSKTVSRTTPQGVENDTTHFVYDGQNRVVETINPDGSSNATVYALALEKPMIDIDGMGRQTRHFFDANGNETNTVFADGTSESFAYDADNRKISMTDQQGRTTIYTNDPLGRVTATQMPDGSVMTTTYDAAGRTTLETDADGNNTYYGYDADGRTSFVTNSLGQVTRYQYDQSGNRTATIDALGRTNEMFYDALDRQIQIVFPDGTGQMTSFDAAGRRAYSQDQAGNETTFGYDALGRLTSVTNTLGYVTRYAYDEAGNEVSQTDANNQPTTFAFDSMGRRIQRTLPGGQTETYGYDGAGNITNHVDFNGRLTTYTYDSFNRLLSKTPDPALGASPVMFTYTPAGQRATMIDASGQTTYSYNSRDWLTNKTETFAIADFSSELNYSYDAQGNMTNISTSDGVSVGYGYDSLNRPSVVKDAVLGATAYGYDSVGNLQSCTYPNSVSSEYEYDSLDRLTNLASAQLNVPIANYGYAVGPAGNRLTASEQLFASVLNPNASTINRIYGYDGIYRLTGETISGASSGTVNYNYDPVGNRLMRSSTLPALASQNFSYDADDHLSTDTYDANGNTLIGAGFGQTTGDQYDFENHLTVRHTSTASMTIEYDGDGNRVAKTVATATNTVTILYLVDERNPSGNSQVLEELVATDLQAPVLNCVYTYGHSLISQRRLTGNHWVSSFYGYDGHDDVRYLTDLNGNVTDTYNYDAFGNLIFRNGFTENGYLFSGEQFDADLDLYYLRARYQSENVDRFWTMDTYEGTTADPISLHKYLFVSANPINRFDPSGHQDYMDELAAAKIGSTLAQTEANVGFATFDQLMYGGNAGFVSLVVGGVVQIGIPAVAISASKMQSIAGLFIAGLTESASLDYRATFFENYPLLAVFKDQIVVHHAVEQQVLKLYPGVFTAEEINSIDNLRGIPTALDDQLHKSIIRKEWDEFYLTHKTATQAELLEKASEIDAIYGNQFVPPIE